MSPLRSAWLVVAPVIEAVAILPFNGKGVQQKADGTMSLNQEGVWIFAFDEEYTYKQNGYYNEPLSSTAKIILGIQAKRTFLNSVVTDKPQEAMMEMTDALRSALQTASAGFVFREANPSFAVGFMDSAQLFADAVDMGVIQITLELKGFDS